MNKFYVLLLLLCFSFYCSVGQNELRLTDVQIATDGSKFEKYADKSANMASDLPAIVLLYKDSSVSYYACFEMVSRGKRMKIRIQDFLLYSGKKFKGDKQVIHRRLKNQVIDRVAGVSEGKIVYNKQLDLSINVVYRYELVL